MTVDPYQNEPAVQIPPDLWDEYTTGVRAVQEWEAYLEIRRAKIEELIGTAHAGMVGNKKVVTYRPINKWSVGGIRRDYAEMAAHFEHEVTRVEFDLNAFRAQHPDIAEKYQTRQFREAG